jgi:hypothetical protein
MRRANLMVELEEAAESKQLKHVETVVHGGLRILSNSLTRSTVRRRKNNTLSELKERQVSRESPNKGGQ